MITLDRLARYKKQALAAVAAGAININAPGITCVQITPHDLLALILCFEKELEKEVL